MAIPESKIKMMYPGEYLEAEDLKGQTVIVTIVDIQGKELEFEKGKKRAFLLTFAGKKKALLLNKTNAWLIAEMFGENPNEWRGKRISIWPTTTRFGPDTVDCIRVYGSPDIPADIKFAKKIGYKMVKATLHKSVTAAPARTDERPAATVPIEQGGTGANLDPAVKDAWSALGWTMEQAQKDFEEYTGDNYLDHLSALVDQQNSDVAP